tara:strand:- start:210 stop:905 length:696 start_codon:yes stop_codon:yes gene_type:complete
MLMANPEQSTGETMFLLLVLIGLAYVAYTYIKSQTLQRENALEAKSSLISNKLSQALDSMDGEGAKSVEVLTDVNLAETRISQGVQSLQVIDSAGVIIADHKGLTFVGPHRRMAWNWNKIIHIIGNQQPPRKFDWFASSWDNFIPVKKSMQNIILPVSNRQRNSGFQIQANDSVRFNIIDFIEHFIGKSIQEESSKEKGNKQSKSASNIVVNVNQTITDSVVQGNLTNFES